MLRRPSRAYRRASAVQIDRPKSVPNATPTYSFNISLYAENKCKTPLDFTFIIGDAFLTYCC
jgi:hypothetical protein